MSPEKIKSQKNFALIAFKSLMLSFVPVALIIVVLLTNSKLRHALFLFSIEFPGYATNFVLQQYIPLRQFDKAVPWLERELSLVNKFAPPQNRMLPGLIANTKYAFKSARFPDEFSHFIPYLTKLVESHPKLYPARLWLARASESVDPFLALEQLEFATKLSSADHRPYRLAINLALKNKMPKQLNDWCKRYQTSQLGGIKPMGYETLFQGIGLRELGLEVVSESGKRQLMSNMALQLGEESYDFYFENGVTVNELRLYLGIIPGMSVQVKKLQLYNDGVPNEVFEENLIIFSWDGFHLRNGRVLTISQDGEMLTILPPKGKFGQADRIVVTLRFERLGIASPYPCGSKINPP
jgi:hypothetical protein